MLLCKKITSLVFLSLLWLVLCISLVIKEHELIAVFFGFVGCIGLATAMVLSNFYLVRFGMPALSTTTTNNLTKAVVGLVACTTSLLGLWKGGTGNEYLALSIFAGYLAYGFWHSSLFGLKCSSFAIVEDTITLTLISIILALKSVSLVGYHVPIRNWIIYKGICFIFSIQFLWQGHTREGQKKQRSVVGAKSRVKSGTKTKGKDTWIIHGEKYDLLDYIESHPGGKEAILLGRGRDCTALFESYHPFTNQNRDVLKKYKLNNANKISKMPEDEFYSILCRRVAETLRLKGIDPKTDRCATPFRVAHYILVTVGLIYSGYFHFKGSIVGSFFLAIFGWLIGSLGHDAGHFSISRYPWINDICVWGMSLLCNPIMWQHQHTYGHHSHTNEFDHDPDLHHFHNLLRVHRRFQYENIYKYQSNWVYVAFAYMFVVFGTCFWIPWSVLESGTIYGITELTDNYQKRPVRAIGMALHMISYVCIIMILPFYTHPSRLIAALAVILHISTSGIIFAIFSQINHINEPSVAAIEERDKAAQSSTSSSFIESSWAAAQVESSNNFATTSAMWHFLSNGLNLQVEHHLFPGLNHCHLHLIAPTVRETCREYNVNYKSYETWSDLMNATLSWLDTLSVDLSQK